MSSPAGSVRSRSLVHYWKMRPQPRTWVSGSDSTTVPVGRQMAPRFPAPRHRPIKRSELYGHTGIHRLLGAGMVADTGRDVANPAGLVVDAELVLPVAISHPEIDVVRVFRAPDRFAGVEGQADRLRVQLDCRVHAGQRIVFVALLSVPSGATADGPELHVLGQEAKIHVVVDLDRPGRIEAAVAVRQTADAGNRTGKAGAALREGGAVVELPVHQRRDVDIALVGL